MGAPIRTSTSDVPDFSTYPAAPSDQLLPEHASAARFDRASRSDRAPRFDNSSRFDDVATQVGTRLGEGMSAFRQLQDRVMDRVEGLRDSVSELVGSFRERSGEVAQEQLDAVRAQSRVQVERARKYAEARPLAVIAAAGIAGLLLGAGVRAWRENRG